MIDRKIDEMGRNLSSFPHHRMKGMELYRLRVKDYRVIYNFDQNRGELYLFAVGHRREIYK